MVLAPGTTWNAPPMALAILTLASVSVTLAGMVTPAPAHTARSALMGGSAVAEDLVILEMGAVHAMRVLSGLPANTGTALGCK